MTDNPLLSIGGADQALPSFDRIRPEHVTPSLDVLLADAQSALEHAVGPQVPADYDTLSAVLDVPLERLSRA